MYLNKCQYVLNFCYTYRWLIHYLDFTKKQGKTTKKTCERYENFSEKKKKKISCYIVKDVETFSQWKAFCMYVRFMGGGALNWGLKLEPKVLETLNLARSILFISSFQKHV